MRSSSTSQAAYLDEPAAGRLNIRYAPAEGDVLVENPPRFTWLPVVEDEARYVLRLSRDPAYPADATQTFSDIALNFFTPETVLEPGSYHWSYAVWDTAKSAPATVWSTSRSFDLGKGLPATPLAGRISRYAGADPDDYPLWGITTKSMQYSAGNNASIPLMDEVARNMRGHGHVIINAGTARKLGIGPDDWVEVSSPHGSTQGRAELVQGCRPDTLVIPGQFEYWKTPFAKDLHYPSLNKVTAMSTDSALKLTDATGSGADIAGQSGSCAPMRPGSSPAKPSASTADW